MHKNIQHTCAYYNKYMTVIKMEKMCAQYTNVISQEHRNKTRNQIQILRRQCQILATYLTESMKAMQIIILKQFGL